MAAVVRVPSKDCKCAIDLFREHEPRQFMRKCHGAEGEEQIGLLARLFRPSIRWSDGEVQMMGSRVALTPNPGSQFLRRHAASARIEQDEFGGHASGFLEGFVERGFARELFLIDGCIVGQTRSEFLECIVEQACLPARANC